MISLSTEALTALAGSFKTKILVESWLDDELLSEEVPVAAASEESDRSLRVPERITLTVPRIDRGVSWSPTTADHPLAANGQKLRVQLGVDLGNGVIEWFTRGWFLIQETSTDGDTVSVAAVGMLALIDEARLVSPYQPSGTLSETIQGLVEPALTVEVDASLVDRSVPSGVNYDEDRLGAVLELLDAWPADAFVHPDGYLAVVPATQSTEPELELTNGTGGTIIRASGTSTREGGFNVVVARGTAADGGQVQGVAYDTTGGPKSFSGPFSPLAVPFFFPSPILTTVAQAQAAAETVLARLRRQAGLEFEVELVPNPAIQLGDVVSITTDDYSDLACAVEALTLPYTPGNSMTLKVRALDG